MKSTRLGSFAELQSRIHIDFTFDPKLVMSNLSPDHTSPPVRVVTLKGGGDTHWSGMEPNQRIFDYLRQLDWPPSSAYEKPES
ncbi:hypothetical protein [Neorhodopirellula lusitana]|uniref:hypothetical protein n=1 Tax=Neorhodopirellula lusitana TaxID=445327 RepID=UPI00384B2F8E